jgi:hypothetical protein
MFRGAGILPASLFVLFTLQKNAGETPAPRNPAPQR